MQLGSRWPALTAPPQSLDESVVQAVLEIERGLNALKQDTSAWYWTLTYLENRPVVQLDDGTTIRLNSSGIIEVTSEN